MKFMIIRKANAETEAAGLPTRELIEAMTRYNEEMVKAGVMLSGDGLAPSREGARVKFRNGRPTVVDGPFAEAKELIAGYLIIEAKSMAEALEWVRKWPKEDAHGNVELEIRRVLTAEDFGEAFTPAMREMEERLRQAAAQQQ